MGPSNSSKARFGITCILDQLENEATPQVTLVEHWSHLCSDTLALASPNKILTMSTKVSGMLSLSLNLNIKSHVMLSYGLLDSSCSITNTCLVSLALSPLQRFVSGKDVVQYVL